MNNNKNKKDIVIDTINSGRLYPRPKDKCDLCTNDIILCWGKTINPYWRHLTKFSANDHSPNSESFNHKFSKEILIKHLSTNRKIKFFHNCKQEFINIPQVAVSFQSEVKYKDCIFDVGCLDANNNLVFGIEVYHTHKTSNTKTRNDIEWVEVKSNDVLNLLDSVNLPNEIQLNDCRERLCCAMNFNEWDMESIAKGLDYIVEYTECEALNMVSVAMHGYYEIKRYWVLEENTSYSINKKLWLEFLGRKKCMSCSKSCDTKIYKPFCLKCFKKYNNDELEIESIEIAYIVQMKNKLRKRFEWLDNIEDGEGHIVCKICEGKICATDEKYSKYFKQGSNFVNQYTLWFGYKKKCICTVCLDELCVKLRISFNNISAEINKERKKEDLNILDYNFDSDSDSD